MKPPHVVVATPTTLVDLLDSRTLPLGHLSTLILDEVDNLINVSGRITESILAHATRGARRWQQPQQQRRSEGVGVGGDGLGGSGDGSGDGVGGSGSSRQGGGPQIVFASATVNDEVRAMASQWMAPGFVDEGLHGALFSPTVKHICVEVDRHFQKPTVMLPELLLLPEKQEEEVVEDADSVSADSSARREFAAELADLKKVSVDSLVAPDRQNGGRGGGGGEEEKEEDPVFLTLRAVLSSLKVTRALCFFSSHSRARACLDHLRFHGVTAEGLLTDTASRDDRVTSHRNAVKGITSGRVSVIVATEMAARGLDLANLSHVVNVGVPADLCAYQHRSGRVGRLGQRVGRKNRPGGKWGGSQSSEKQEGRGNHDDVGESSSGREGSRAVDVVPDGPRYSQGTVVTIYEQGGRKGGKNLWMRLCSEIEDCGVKVRQVEVDDNGHFNKPRFTLRDVEKLIDGEAH